MHFCSLYTFCAFFQFLRIFQFFSDDIFFGLASGQTERRFRNEPGLRNVGTKRNYWSNAIEIRRGAIASHVRYSFKQYTWILRFACGSKQFHQHEFLETCFEDPRDEAKSSDEAAGEAAEGESKATEIPAIFRWNRVSFRLVDSICSIRVKRNSSQAMDNTLFRMNPVVPWTRMEYLDRRSRGMERPRYSQILFLVRWTRFRD